MRHVITTSVRTDEDIGGNEVQLLHSIVQPDCWETESCLFRRDGSDRLHHSEQFILVIFCALLVLSPSLSWKESRRQ